MSAEEYAHWLEFSIRLARHGWPDATDRRKGRIAEVVEWFILEYESSHVDVGGWDGSEAGVYVCDDIGEFLAGLCHRPEDPMDETRFERQVSSCVRAGLDVASEPSTGVVGFSVGTLRRMFDGEIPTWVSEWFEPGLTGLEPDNAGVWL